MSTNSFALKVVALSVSSGWETKSSENILIQELYDNLMIGILSGYSLNPLGEIISGY